MSRYYDENEMARRRKEERSDDTYKAIINISNTIDANYSYLKSIDSSLEDIKSITEIKSDIADTRDLLSSVLVELKRNNTLKQRELREKAITETKDLTSYANKHLLYEDVNFNNAIKFVIALSKKTKVKYRISSNTMRVGALAAELTNLNDGDYFLIDYNSLSDTTIAKLIHATKKMELCFNHNGKNVKLPLPRFNCVIFTECKETIDESLLKCLEVVK